MDKETEILSIAQEECAEVIQAISKCFRFGLDNVKPGKPKTNREHLEEELGDLMAMLKKGGLKKIKQFQQSFEKNVDRLLKTVS